jgi:hypothetical protein
LLRESLLALWVLGTLSFSWMYSVMQGPNEQTRAYLTAALVDDHQIQIDRSLTRFGTVYDLASYEGHFYSDKAPGSSLLAAPVYALARLGMRTEAESASQIVDLARNWLMLPFALLGFVALRALLRRLGRSQSSIDLSSIAYSLGSAAMHYSTAFYGHVLVATLLISSLWAMSAAGVFERERAEGVRHRFLKLAFAGLCAGFAGLTEYQATLVAMLFVVPVLSMPERRVHATLAYLCGAVPCALALFAYNTAAFGGPLQLSYQHLVGASLQSLHGSGLAGATWPTREAVLGLLISAHRGLLTTSPWTLGGVVGLWFMARAGVRALWATLALCIVYLFFAVASSSVWHGGWAFGPRLLIPALPLLAIGAAYAFDALARYAALDVLARAGVIFGVLYQQLVQVTFSELPPELKWPLQEAVAPVLRAGIVAPNLVCKVLPYGITNMVPLAISCLLLSVFLAWPRLSSRLRGATQVGVCLLLVALCFWGLWRVEPNATPQQQLDWAGWIGSFVPQEKSCKIFPPAPPPPGAK